MFVTTWNILIASQYEIFWFSKWNYGNIWDFGFGHIGTNMTPKFVIVSQLSHCAEVLIRSFRNVGSKYPVSGKAKAVDPKWKKFLSLMIINCWQEAPFVKSICNGPEIIHWKFLLCPPVLNMSDTCRHSRIWTKNWPKVLKDNIS